MLGDTLTLPHADGDIVCSKINQDAYSSEYLNRTATTETKVKVRHSNVKANPTTGSPAKDRHNVEVTQTIFATSEVAEYQRKFYVVVEQLPSDTDVKVADALCDWLIASADAKLVSLLGWES
jgi:hypothetical protein